MSRFFATVLIALAACVSTALPVKAQMFPDHPIRLIVPYPPGGPADTVARATTQGLGTELGGSVVIENLPGAGGRLGVKDATRAAPDGYTLLLGGTNECAITPALYRNLDYDPIRGLTAVAAVATDSNAIIVNPALPVHTLAELVRYAKDNPDKLTSGATLGIAPHLLLEFFRVRAGMQMTFVPYKGAAPMLADVMGGHIQVAASAKSVLLPLVRAGKLRALAVTSTARWPELPDVPTLHESGLDGYPPDLWFGLVAPTGTPAGIIAKINAAENARLGSPEVQTAIANLGLQPQMLTVPEFSKVLTDEVRLWKAVTDEAGVHLEE